MNLHDDLPIHPRTGLTAVGIINGRPVWPILGASEDNEGDGDDGSEGGQQQQWAAPASQEELNRIIEQRLARERAKYAGFDDYKAKAEKHDALEAELASETDKQVRAAREEERAKLAGEFAPRLVREAFKAEAKGVLTKEQLDGLLEDYNPSNYLDGGGDVDGEKIAARVAKFAPAKTDGKTATRSVNLGQGNHQQATPSQRDIGRAAAQKRFGTTK